VNSGDAVSVLDASWCKPGWGEGERIVRAMCYVAPRRKGDGGVFKGMGCALNGRARGGAEKLLARTLCITCDSRPWSGGCCAAAVPGRMTCMECAARARYPGSARVWGGGATVCRS
jgi:hypothetical protein